MEPTKDSDRIEPIKDGEKQEPIKDDEKQEPIKDGDIVIIQSNARDNISIVLNAIIIGLALAGVSQMVHNVDTDGALMSSGLDNLKYYTVLSNIFCMIMAIVFIVLNLMNKKCPILPKFMAAAAVGLTFVIVAFFLAPMYPDLDMYDGANEFFHRWVPIVAVIEFIMFEQEKKMPFRYTFIAAGTSVAYGLFYLVNILINGIGTWPDTNDWYGFLNWGYPVGIVIFLVVVLMNWIIALLLWLIKQKVK